jgi:hypothetical protein
MQMNEIDAVKEKMTNMIEEAQNKTQPVQTARQSFDVEFFTAANTFAQNILEAIPELRAISIVPVFKPQPDNDESTAGILRGRNPNEPQTGIIIRALQQISIFAAQLDRTLFRQLREYDKYHNELVTEIKRRQDEFNALAPPVAESADPQSQK